MKIVYLLIALFIIPAYHVAKPWIQFHNDHLIIYDCATNSLTSPLGAKYPGKIKSLLVEVGQRVELNQTVAVMDTSELDALAAKAQAAIELAKSNLETESAKIKQLRQTLDAEQNCQEAKSRVAEKQTLNSKIETQLIEREFHRLKTLVKRNSVSQSELERMQRAVQNHRSRVSLAEANESVAKLETAALRAQAKEILVREKSLKALQQKIDIAEAELESIQERREAANIKSPTDGYVSEIFRGSGASARTGDPILQIQSDDVWSEIWIDETELSSFQMNTDVKVSLKAFPETEFDGQVVGWITRQENLKLTPSSTDNPMLQPQAKICLRVDLNLTDLQEKQHRLMPGLTGRAILKKPNGAPLPSSRASLKQPSPEFQQTTAKPQSLKR